MKIKRNEIRLTESQLNRIIRNSVKRALAEEIQTESDPEYDEIDNDYFSGPSRVTSGGKWNFVNSEGELISPKFWFDEVGQFVDGIAEVMSNDMVNLIYKNGKLLSDRWFDYIEKIGDHHFVGYLDNEKYYIIREKTELNSQSHNLIK